MANQILSKQQATKGLMAAFESASKVARAQLSIKNPNAEDITLGLHATERSVELFNTLREMEAVGFDVDASVGELKTLFVRAQEMSEKFVSLNYGNPWSEIGLEATRDEQLLFGAIKEAGGFDVEPNLENTEMKP
jgi:hypothetical protein